MSAYAGIGSRQTPEDVLSLMYDVAFKLSDSWTLRTGGAEGADEAFGGGAVGGADGSYHGVEVYLPWEGFNGWGQDDEDGIARFEPQPEAYAIAEQHHPSWGSLSRGAKALHSRNVHQVLGFDVTEPDLSKFVLCWTRNAAGGGGTGQAIRVARTHGVPVFDLADPAARARIEKWLV